MLLSGQSFNLSAAVGILALVLSTLGIEYYVGSSFLIFGERRFLTGFFPHILFLKRRHYNNGEKH